MVRVRWRSQFEIAVLSIVAPLGGPRQFFGSGTNEGLVLKLKHGIRGSLPMNPCSADWQAAADTGNLYI